MDGGRLRLGTYRPRFEFGLCLTPYVLSILSQAMFSSPDQIFDGAAFLLMFLVFPMWLGATATTLLLAAMRAVQSSVRPLAAFVPLVAAHTIGIAMHVFPMLLFG